MTGKAARRLLLVALSVVSAAAEAAPPAKPAATAPSGALAGKVTRARDRAAVPGATVRARPAEGDKSTSVTTGADGGYRFPALREGFWNLTASAPGMVEGSAYRVEVTAGATAERDLSLHLAATVRGEVRGENGKPLAGAKVDWGRGVRTDAAGRYTLTGVAPMEGIQISASAPGHVQGSTASFSVAEGATVEAPPLVLETAARLAGRITDSEGKPVPGVDVYFYGRDVEQGSWGSAKTDSQGRFTVDGLRAGTHSWSANKEGYEHLDGGNAAAVKGETRELPPIVLTLRPPLFVVWTQDKVFLPGVRPKVYFNAFRVRRFTTEIFAVDPLPVLRRTASLEKLAEADLAGARRAGVVAEQTVSYKRVLEEVHGRGLTLPALEPGVYVVRARTEAGAESRTWIQVSDLALVAKETAVEALYYAADLATSRPRRGVELVGYPGETPLGSTDADGLLRVADLAALPAGPIVARDPARPAALAFLHTHGRGEPAPDEEWRAYLETDRPIYRPGQEVFYKGTVRADRRGEYAIARPERLELTITDAQGSTLESRRVELGATGSFDGKLLLDEDAALGYYSVGLSVPGGADGERAPGSGQRGAPPMRGGSRAAVHLQGGTFRVEEYRKPEFAVDVSTDRAWLVGGGSFTATISASYYFGGPVAGAAITYDVYSTPYWAGDLFPDASPCYDCWEGWEERAGWAGRGYGELVLHGEAKSDTQGRVVVTVPTKRPRDSDRRYQVVARVADPTGREVQDAAQTLVTRARFALQVETARAVVYPEEEVAVVVRAVDFDGKPVATPFTLRLLEEKWARGKSTTTLITETSGATDEEGRGEVTVRAGRSGSLRLYALAKDESGNLTDATGHLWSAGPGWTLAESPLGDLALVTDKASYRPGETARVLVTSGVPGIDVLLTLEGERLHEARRLRLEGASAVVEIPIRSAHLPTLHIAAAAVAKRTFYSAQRAVPVSPEEKLLKVTVTPARDTYRPRERAAFNVETRDAAGRGVAAEVSVAVVDEAIYALSRELVPDIRLAFYGPRPNRVVTSHSFPRAYEGGADKFDEEERRRRFKDTAFWDPYVRTDAAGRARVEFELPDNLTTWRATARAATADTRVGEARGKTVARKELMVRLAAPRFFTAGDEARLRAALHNETDSPLAVRARAQATGVELLAPEEGTHQVPAHGVATFDLPVRALAAGQAHLVLDAAGGGFADGIELELQVLPFGAIVTEAAAGATADRAAAALTLPAGADPSSTELTVHLSPSLAAGLLDALDALHTYPYGCIEQTVSGFVPAVVVRRAFAALDLDYLDQARFAAELPERIADGLERLADLQHEDGGWGWWEHDPSHPFLTAYVVFGIGLMRDAGEPFDPEVDAMLGRGRAALGRRLETATEPDVRAWVLYALARSGDLSSAQREAARALDSDPGDLAPYGRALLTSVLATFDRMRASASARALLALARRGTGTLYWDAPAPKLYTWVGSDVEATAYGALALLDSLPPGTERDSAVEGALRFLVQSRRGAWWSSTKDTAAAVLAATAWLGAHSGELDPRYQAVVRVNQREMARRDIGKQDVPAFMTRIEADPALLREGENRVEIEKGRDRGRRARGDEPARLYWSALLRAILPERAQTPVEAGFRVRRSYQRLGLEQRPDGTWQRTARPFDPARETVTPGERLEVRVEVEAERDFAFVMIEDPLPSGFEVEDAFGRDGSEYDERAWGWWFARREVRDEKVTFFATRWPEADAPGRPAKPQEFVYTIRAEVPGTKHVQPAEASLMYFPEVRGASAGAVIRVEGPRP